MLDLESTPEPVVRNKTEVNRIDFLSTLRQHGLGEIYRAPLSVLQVNLGRLCNQACEHCHVDAGPKRKEIMSRNTMQRIVDWCSQNAVAEVDITGGAPEMNPHFRWFVDTLMETGINIISRCNLTILLEPGHEDLADWYAERKVSLVCSLPCYSESNVDGQRGKGVFDKSIRALQRLNKLGYGHQSGSSLDLVYNPGGAFLPPCQAQLEADYRRELKQRFEVSFSNLLALANLPINRFSRYLRNTGQLDSYYKTLHDAFNAGTVPGLMCRHLLSVDWQGYVYDCDFNQMLGLPAGGTRTRNRLWDLHAPELLDQKVGIGNHCYGCTAGAGSSCSGNLV